MDAAKGPEVSLILDWRGDLRFEGEKLVVDGDGRAGPSPVQALAYALAGCMAADLVDIIRKGRFPLKSVRIDLHGERAATQPRRLLKVSLHFHVEGEVPEDRVERAIALSKDTYCSVWHSLRQDIAFETSFEVISGAPGSGT